MANARTWFFVGDGGSARIFEVTIPGAELRLVEEHKNPEAHMRDRDLTRDKPNRGRSPASGVPFVIDETSAHDQAEEQFIGKCAVRLDKAAASGAFAKLVLIAPPKVLGVLRRKISPATSKLVAATFDKDLGKMPAYELPAYLEKHVGRV